MKYAFLACATIICTALPAIAFAEDCSHIKSGDLVTTDFAAPYSVTNPNKPLHISVNCTDDTALISLGSGNPNEYIYKYAYTGDSVNWDRIQVTGSTEQGSWFTGHAYIALDVKEKDIPVHILAYVCTRTATDWKCGCSDAACTQPNWQQQIYHVPDGKSSPTHDDAFAERIARDVHYYTNIERATLGLKPLKWDDRLSKIAIGHSKDMAQRNYFAHESPEGCNSTCRIIEQDGYKASAWAENLAYVKSPRTSDLARRFVTNLLESPTHRKIMLSPKYMNEGVGIAYKDNRHYVTANFSVPK